VEYLIKWEGYPDDENTWQGADDMNCPDLVREFEESETLKGTPKRKKEKRLFSETEPKKKEEKLETFKESVPDEEYGIEYGDQPDYIIGARMQRGELYHYVSW
jgi:chromobox protein 1